MDRKKAACVILAVSSCVNNLTVTLTPPFIRRIIYEKITFPVCRRAGQDQKRRDTTIGGCHEQDAFFAIAVALSVTSGFCETVTENGKSVVIGAYVEFP